ISTFFFQAEDGIRYDLVTGVQTCALPIFLLGLLPQQQVQRRRFRPEESAAVFGSATGDDLRRPDQEGSDPLLRQLRVRARAADRSEERRVGKEGSWRGAGEWV